MKFIYICPVFIVSLYIFIEERNVSMPRLLLLLSPGDKTCVGKIPPPPPTPPRKSLGRGARQVNAWVQNCARVWCTVQYSVCSTVSLCVSVNWRHAADSVDCAAACGVKRRLASSGKSWPLPNRWCILLVRCAQSGCSCKLSLKTSLGKQDSSILNNKLNNYFK